MTHSSPPVIVWIDSKVAKVFTLASLEDIHVHTLHREEPAHHVNPHTPRAGHYEERFFKAVAGHLRGAEDLLVLGHGVAKDQFVHHLEQHDRELSRAVVGVESSDHPTDPQLVAYARKHFRAHRPVH